MQPQRDAQRWRVADQELETLEVGRKLRDSNRDHTRGRSISRNGNRIAITIEMTMRVNKDAHRALSDACADRGPASCCKPLAKLVASAFIQSRELGVLVVGDWSVSQDITTG